MEKLILFDLFGVIIDSHSKTNYNVELARKEIANYCNIDYEKFLEFFKDSNFGITNSDDFKSLIKKYIDLNNSNVTVDEFTKIYLESYGKILCFNKVLDLINYLQNNKLCKTGILSNLCVLDKKYIEKNLNIDDFDYLFLSCDLNMEKPNNEIYEYVMKKCKLKGEDILFIDDNLENIEIAKSLGWNVFNANGYEIDKIKEICNLFLEK